jgi:hypothetical protein
VGYRGNLMVIMEFGRTILLSGVGLSGSRASSSATQGMCVHSMHQFLKSLRHRGATGYSKALTQRDLDHVRHGFGGTLGGRCSVVLTVSCQRPAPALQDAARQDTQRSVELAQMQDPDMFRTIRIGVHRREVCRLAPELPQVAGYFLSTSQPVPSFPRAPLLA